MKCPKCNSENNDSAKFCKKCGTPLTKKVMNHETIINSINEEKSGSDKTTKIIIVALVIIAIALAGVFAYVGLENNNHSNTQTSPTPSASNSTSSVSTATPTSSQSTAQPAQSSMKIKGGSFSTGSELEDKTYAHLLIGPEHAGKQVTIQIFYSRDGSTLNHGNMVPVTIDSSGYVDVSSADAYSYFPDYAKVRLYDSSGNNLLDTKEVSLQPTSGTQTF